MIEEVSAGGVVIFGNTILLLKKFNGDWVLPKGRIEKNESPKDAALREVLEESRVKAKVLKYIDNVSYDYKNLKKEERVYKTVHWYLMKTNCMDCTPQKQEGFVDAVFVHVDRVKNLMRYEDEKNIVTKGLEIIKSL